jgi:hypothetical protein
VTRRGERKPNDLLRAARLARVSPSGSGRPMSREIRVGAITHGRQTVFAMHTFERIAEGLNMPDDARLTLGIAPRRSPATGESHGTGGVDGVTSGRAT